ncbi:hypothetical protein BP6252_10884 [Coleophoma cylindrospora]|uniref:Uncharacterized protein n=1 Tax=Coleophoma cylindrospora TaxID=1849047 RepID=A0A3D8QNI3_9HELO|nr:hypothetical protein BP6252_10884 [Coleophoma cylindrospora]
MQLKYFVAAATLLFASNVSCTPNPEAAPNPEAGPNELADSAELVPRKCPRNGCSVAPGTTSGKYCGYCWQVLTKWDNEHIYQLNSNGDCCDYGYSKKCAAGFRTLNQAYCDGHV